MDAFHVVVSHGRVTPLNYMFQAVTPLTEDCMQLTSHADQR